MRILFVALILFSYTAVSEDKLATSFESNYLLLQKKIESLKEHGQKVNEKTREEIDALMVQMNHEHAELKRQVEKIKSLKENAKESGVDWSERLQAAYHELSAGAARAWKKIKKD